MEPLLLAVPLVPLRSQTRLEGSNKTTLKERGGVMPGSHVSKNASSCVLTRHEAIDVMRLTLLSLPVTAAALVGSFARDEQTSESDIDLLVSFEKGAGIGDVELVREALASATGRRVDLITTLDGQTEHFRDSLKRDGLKIYG